MGTFRGWFVVFRPYGGFDRFFYRSLHPPCFMMKTRRGKKKKKRQYYHSCYQFIPSRQARTNREKDLRLVGQCPPNAFKSRHRISGECIIAILIVIDRVDRVRKSISSNFPKGTFSVRDGLFLSMVRLWVSMAGF